MKNTITSLVISLLIVAGPSWSQVAMGKWRTHFAYNSVSQIAQSENKIYAVSEGALYSIDKEDGGLEFYSKLSGLNGANISRIEFDSQNKQLLIIYANGNIDILGNGGVTNIPDLFNKQMNSSKKVNQIQFHQNRAYLSCDFGILVLNLQKKEIADTYFIGPNATEVKVLNTAIHNGTIYALTPSVLYQASVSQPNLVNYEFWSAANNLPGGGDLQAAVSFSGNLFLLRGGKIYRQENNVWQPFLPELSVSNINTSNGSMHIFASNGVHVVNSGLNTKIIPDLGIVMDAEFDATNNTHWFAANSAGVISYSQSGTEDPVVSHYKPAGPAVNRPFQMKFSGKKLFVVPGSRWVFDDIPAYVMILEDNAWRNISYTTIEAITGIICRDFISIDIDPKDNSRFFAASYRSGLYEFRNNEFFFHHNITNSTIERLFNDNQYQNLGASVFDKEGNLWVLQQFIKNNIKLYLANGTWTQFTYPGIDNKPSLGGIIISNQNPNQKLIYSARSGTGLCIFDDNGTLTDQSDDKSRFFTTFPYPETDKNNNTVIENVTPAFIYSFAQDKNGVVWVGTDQGPFLFSNLSKAFNNDYTCSRVKIPRNDSTGWADYLLKEEKIKAIAIDGANRKWIGTEGSGVYLMSENGQQTIQHFTASNSPLLSNDILSIAINPVTGEVFIGTGQGLVSYQGDASEAGDTFGEVRAYPNPVRQGFTGVITITGLMNDTQVKITDLIGNLVCQTVSNGSIATWDGKDGFGRKVSTGVYLAMCTTSDGSKSAITKILVIN